MSCPAYGADSYAEVTVEGVENAVTGSGAPEVKIASIVDCFTPAFKCVLYA
jgi:hypothetical protein